MLTRPSLLIRDSIGRCFWESNFGQSNCVVFSSFEDTLLEHWRSRLDNSEKEEMALRNVLNFLLNFPSDGLVTPYKWDILLGQWGNFNNLLDNLRHVALRPGFLGVMNGRQAEELLTSLSGDFALIRFSSNSKTLSVAYTSQSLVKHERKPPTLDILQFLKSILKGKTLVPYSLMWDKINQLKTIEDCVKTPVAKLFCPSDRSHC